MRIVLIGFMGSGKSTVAQILAKKLNLNHYGTDYLVRGYLGRKSIEEIFKKDGEKKFREAETKIIKDLEKKDSCIISSGGGVVMKPKDMESLKKNSKVIYLKTEFETILKRVKTLKNRPLLKDKDKAKQIYTERLPFYKKAADVIIETEGKSPKAIASEIASLVE